LSADSSLFTLILNHQHHTDDRTGRTANRRSGVTDRNLSPVPTNKQHAILKIDRTPFLQAAHRRVRYRLSSDFRDHRQHQIERLTPRFVKRPTGEPLTNRIEVRDRTVGAGGNDGITDRLHDRTRGLIIPGSGWLRHDRV